MSAFDLEGERRTSIPLMLAVMLVLVAGSRFEATRAIEANVFAYGFPVLAAWMALGRLRESSERMRTVAIALGAALVLAAEPRVMLAFGVAPPAIAGFAATRISVGLLVAIVVAAAVVQAAAARRGMRVFAGAWVGMAAALAIYLPTTFSPDKERFGQVLAALFVALFAGGGAGFVAGALVTSFVKPSAAS